MYGTDYLHGIAKTCHEANKAWCEINGDWGQKDWVEAKNWQRDSAIKGVIWRLDNPNALPDAQHNAWMEFKIADGWVYGEVKDANTKTHPCLVAYNRLPKYQRCKDQLFNAIVDALR